ncbi:amino acid--[acyl-carrier-protein] ligase [Bacillus cereus group sp. MYBK108-2]|uniref:amino acid--[acyl-carrier-protein] ligase n=1 Tax=unclassified Bacillus cereus group TaxID=2750818 RepID=UPI0028902B95|nr:amino acid--[acyl-carrier-protein] ligase [Bacillus cereus]MDA2307631.1 amino acid--[acyl-carrier-protein] ligase [Bacillus cereus]HDX9634236.1 amino acid--[acyl-carrier-protein] ligase [Bacillus cereus]HEF1897123.1 amino acid--[acyl-carrier-protein] ligase [Bacillus cereus]
MESTIEVNLLDSLIKNSHLIPTGVKGVYGKGKYMQLLLTNLENYLCNIGRTESTEIMTFPPVMNKESIEVKDYVKSFPHLLGTVNSFFGGNSEYKGLMKSVEEGKEWTDHYSKTEVVMTPAACYPVYPSLSGTLNEGGRVVEVSSFCFRHEPSDEPTRMISFKMLEYVFAGTPAEVTVWREKWIEKAKGILKELKLDFNMVVADDPFFGKGGKLLKLNQKQLELKYELVVPVNSVEKPTAVISSNYHQDLFSKKHHILTHGNEHAHTSCLAFGLERLAIALMKNHGMAFSEWPESVVKLLNLDLKS